MSYEGKKNVYACEKGHKTVTVDRDDGVTPFFIRCTRGNCDSMAQSSFYKVDQTLRATHEWYRPKRRELIKLKRKSPATVDHVKKGGLLIRPIKGKAWKPKAQKGDSDGQ